MTLQPVRAPREEVIAIRRLAQRFGPACVSGLDEPVRRYLSHAIGDGATDVRLTMSGRINVGRWLSFTAEQEFVGHDFAWSARAGWSPLKPLHVVDAYRDGRGSTDGRLFGRLQFLHADDENTTRAAAARAAVESIWVPGTLLPDRGATWRAQSDDCIIANFDVPPEPPEVRLRIDAAGAARSVSVMRWGNVGQRDYGYIPFGGHIHAERRFRERVLPSQIMVGWWFGTPRFKPFLKRPSTTHSRTTQRADCRYRAQQPWICIGFRSARMLTPCASTAGSSRPSKPRTSIGNDATSITQRSLSS